MFQTHRSRAVRAAAMVALIVGALACEGEDGVHSDRPPADRQVDPAKHRTVVIRVTEASGPYDVWVRAAKAGQVRGDYTREKVAGGPYRQTLDYTSGLRIEVTITVTGHRTDIFRCEITDGERKVRERAAGTVQCKLTTSR